MGLTKSIKKVVKKAAKLTLIDAVAPGAIEGVIDNFAGTDLTGQKAAQRDAENAANAQAAEQQQLLRNMQSNFASDLKGDNLSNVIAGGSADVVGMGSDATRRRRRAGGLTAALGV